MFVQRGSEPGSRGFTKFRLWLLTSMIQCTGHYDSVARRQRQRTRNAAWCWRHSSHANQAGRRVIKWNSCGGTGTGESTGRHSAMSCARPFTKLTTDGPLSDCCCCGGGGGCRRRRRRRCLFVLGVCVCVFFGCSAQLYKDCVLKYTWYVNYNKNCLFKHACLICKLQQRLAF